MSKTVTFDMCPALKARLKRLAKQSDVSFQRYCNEILSEAADKDVVVKFSLVPQAANFSERSETPEITED